MSRYNVFFFDADDIAPPAYVSRSIAAIEKAKADGRKTVMDRDIAAVVGHDQ